jgi:hypothetical protein
MTPAAAEQLAALSDAIRAQAPWMLERREPRVTAADVRTRSMTAAELAGEEDTDHAEQEADWAYDQQHNGDFGE